jgi:hypothetical protein
MNTGNYDGEREEWQGGKVTGPQVASGALQVIAMTCHLRLATRHN